MNLPPARTAAKDEGAADTNDDEGAAAPRHGEDLIEHWPQVCRRLAAALDADPQPLGAGPKSPVPLKRVLSWRRPAGRPVGVIASRLVDPSGDRSGFGAESR
jgi:hypothetical protein